MNRQPTEPTTDGGYHPIRFLRRLLRAIVDEQTYDLRGNPPLVVGFLMALPIPIVVWLAGAPLWLLILSVPAPLFWGVVLGAAGRVGIRAERQAQRLAREVAKTQREAQAVRRSYEEALDEESARRVVLERREQAALNEMKLAASVHRTLLPDAIHRPEVEVAVSQIPSQFVGGDYLHARVAGDRYLYLCVGDVSGHGTAAALVVARIHGLIHRLTFEKLSKPVTILERVNRAVLNIFKHTYFFLTFAVFRLDLTTGQLRYATAGHPAQVLLRKDGRIRSLRTPNRLLGMDHAIFDEHHPSDRVQLDPGDTVVLFTDGLFEILSTEDGEILGEEGLHERIRSVQGMEPSVMAGEILQELADFQGRSKFEDDVSLMVMTWKGPQEKA